MIRILKQNDVDDAYNLTKEMLKNAPASFPDSFDEDNLSKSFFSSYINDGPRCVIIGYYVGNKLVGMAGIYGFQNKKSKHKGCIWNVYVSPEYRGKKIASKLIDACIKYAKKIELEWLVLNVSSGALNAMKLYKKHGFKVFGVEKDSIRTGGKSYTEYKMELKLEK